MNIKVSQLGQPRYEHHQLGQPRYPKQMMGVDDHLITESI
jgi:hypothetical protein